MTKIKHIGYNPTHVKPCKYCGGPGYVYRNKRENSEQITIYYVYSNMCAVHSRPEFITIYNDLKR